MYRAKPKGTYKQRPGYTQSSSGFTARYNRGKGSELKYLDRRLTSASSAVAGLILNSNTQGTGINDVYQGPAGFQRLGSKFTIKSLEVAWSVKLPAAVKTGATAVDFAPRLARVMIVLDKQANGLIPVNGFADIMVTTAEDGTGTAPSSVKAKPFVPNNRRFQIIMDEVVELVNQAAYIEGTDGKLLGDYVSGKFYKSFPGGLEIEMSGPEAAVTNIKSNNLLAVVASDTWDADQPLTFDVETRIRFTDY